MFKLKQLFNNNGNSASFPSICGQAPPPKGATKSTELLPLRSLQLLRKRKSSQQQKSASRKACEQSTNGRYKIEHVRPLHALYQALSRDDARTKAELIWLPESCGFATAVPDTRWPSVVSRSARSFYALPSSGCCLPGGTRLKGVWKNGTFAEVPLKSSHQLCTTCTVVCLSRNHRLLGCR